MLPGVCYRVWTVQTVTVAVTEAVLVGKVVCRRRYHRMGRGKERYLDEEPYRRTEPDVRVDVSR